MIGVKSIEVTNHPYQTRSKCLKPIMNRIHQIENSDTQSKDDKLERGRSQISCLGVSSKEKSCPTNEYEELTMEDFSRKVKLCYIKIPAKCLSFMQEEFPVKNNWFKGFEILANNTRCLNIFVVHSSTDISDEVGKESNHGTLIPKSFTEFTKNIKDLEPPKKNTRLETILKQEEEVQSNNVTLPFINRDLEPPRKKTKLATRLKQDEVIKPNNITLPFIPSATELVKEVYSFSGSTKNCQTRGSYSPILTSTLTDVQWVGESFKTERGRHFYRAAVVGNQTVKKGDCVLISANENNNEIIGKVQYLFESRSNKMGHCQWFIRGQQTILGEVSPTNLLFQTEYCENISLENIRNKVFIDYKETWPKEDQENSLFYSQKYNEEQSRFEDINISHIATIWDCSNCEILFKTMKYQTPHIFEPLCPQNVNNEYRKMVWKGEDYYVGSCVLLTSDTFPGPSILASSKTKQDLPAGKYQVDENIYPEMYRKSSEYIKGSNIDTPAPFCIGYILSIVADNCLEKGVVPKGKLWVRVKRFYRPEDIQNNEQLATSTELNLLYWSDEEFLVEMSKVVGKCSISYKGHIYESIDKWTLKGPNRFFFEKMYNSTTGVLQKVPPTAMNVGRLFKKNQRKNSPLEEWPQLKSKLRTMDLFAGCGGLSEGLVQSGVAEIKWAVENDESAAQAFKLNHPKCTVIKEDCNVLLEEILTKDARQSKRDLKLPKKGEVDLLCGGPPCQGFSVLNHHTAGKSAFSKNSLIATFLSYCDYFRPKYLIMENVRNFVSHNKSLILKFVICCLIKMGYQCTFGILQAGSYGIPQTRRRLIVLATASGYSLPKFPLPTHVFSPRTCSLDVTIDTNKYSQDLGHSAPLRTITVNDSIGDLPGNCGGPQMKYKNCRISPFQKQMRGGSKLLHDHETKSLSRLCQERIKYIPKKSGADWRDLPNIEINNIDGLLIKKLQYKYGKDKNGIMRGVCSCANGKANESCNINDRQFNTLIPWWLPHTAERNNNFAGVYGRLDWEDHFSTTLTKPNPQGKQGRVLHPQEDRMITIRECARSQGFFDTFHFYGTITERYRQVGNAVAPPLAAAIGYEIRKCLVQKK